jgi:hypothetical protein
MNIAIVEYKDQNSGNQCERFRLTNSKGELVYERDYGSCTQSIDEYFDDFLEFIRPKKEVTIIPHSQKEILKKAIDLLQDAVVKIGSTDEYLMFDLATLKALLNYEIGVALTEQEKERFTYQNGIDFPEYIN